MRSPPGCSPAGVGGGAVAFACPSVGYTGGAGAVVDLRTGAVEAMGPLALASIPSAGLDRVTVSVGKRWVRLRIVGYHYAVDGFVERGTGRLMPSKPWGDLVGDPDARSVWRPLCDPLHLRSWQGGESGLGDTAPYAYRFPVGASITQRDEDARVSIVVERCGRPRPLLVHRCSIGCDPSLIGAGVVAWRDGDRLRAFLPRARRRLSWALPDHRFVVTRHRIWVVRDWRLLSARV